MKIENCKLKIALISPISWRTPPRNYGPWELVASNIAEGLVKRGFEVTLFATGDSKTSGKLQWVCPRPVEEDKSLDSEVYKFLHLAKVFESANKFDIIHNQFDYYALPFSSFIKTPIITTINGFHNEQYKEIYKKYNKKVHYVSISNANRAKELDYIATVYNGINLDDFHLRSERSPRSPHFVSGNRKYLLFIGRISRDKGTDRAIKVAKMAKLPLVIAGQVPPEEKKYFAKYVKPHLNNKNIKWIGPVGPKERNKVLQSAIASLHMINFDEPFGLTVTEAMAAGVPVIAINRGSMPEIITDKVDGFLVKDDKEALLAIKKINTIDHTKCRAKVKAKFTNDIMVEEYIKVYEKVLCKTFS